MSQIDNIIIQVRSRLQELSIKLWLEPYYYNDVGVLESEIDQLAKEFSDSLGISESNCKLALTELQEGALRKLAARKEYENTGIATFSVRRINNQEGTQNILEIKCSLHALGSELLANIAENLNLHNQNQIKCISGGRIVDPNKTLDAQGIKNNQQLMIIISEIDANSKEAMYDRIRQIKMDVEKIVDSGTQLFEMEDQDGNPVFLPPAENRALLMAMSFYEKARSAIKRQKYDEALILLLEADEKFSTCNSKFLETVDNYALVNLDIVWCYLCLKNVTQLPDAQRRLEICERSFSRSYGDNFNRLIALKGNACPERALIMRLHLLQGIVCFHQNRRDEAYEKFDVATKELRELKVNDEDIKRLVEMGYKPFEARLALRASGGNLENAITFIYDRKEKLHDARMRSEKERKLNNKLVEKRKDAKDWVNPRSVCTLTEMGFESDLVVEALKQSKNDVPVALDLLQKGSEELRRSIKSSLSANEEYMEQLIGIGFDEDVVRIALETCKNDFAKTLEFIMKTFNTDDTVRATVERILADSSEDSCPSSPDGPSTSNGSSTSNDPNSLISKALRKASEEVESLAAYSRFNEDVNTNVEDYLDLPLEQEEQILVEYKRLLEQ